MKFISIVLYIVINFITFSLGKNEKSKTRISGKCEMKNLSEAEKAYYAQISASFMKEKDYCGSYVVAMVTDVNSKSEYKMVKAMIKEECPNCSPTTVRLSKTAMKDISSGDKVGVMWGIFNSEGKITEGPFYPNLSIEARKLLLKTSRNENISQVIGEFVNKAGKMVKNNKVHDSYPWNVESNAAVKTAETKTKTKKLSFSSSATTTTTTMAKKSTTKKSTTKKATTKKSTTSSPATTTTTTMAKKSTKMIQYRKTTTTTKKVNRTVVTRKIVTKKVVTRKVTSKSKSENTTIPTTTTTTTTTKAKTTSTENSTVTTNTTKKPTTKFPIPKFPIPKFPVVPPKFPVVPPKFPIPGMPISKLHSIHKKPLSKLPYHGMPFFRIPPPPPFHGKPNYHHKKPTSSMLPKMEFENKKQQQLYVVENVPIENNSNTNTKKNYGIKYTIVKTTRVNESKTSSATSPTLETKVKEEEENSSPDHSDNSSNNSGKTVITGAIIVSFAAGGLLLLAVRKNSNKKYDLERDMRRNSLRRLSTADDISRATTMVAAANLKNKNKNNTNDNNKCQSSPVPQLNTLQLDYDDFKNIAHIQIFSPVKADKEYNYEVYNIENERQNTSDMLKNDYELALEGIYVPDQAALNTKEKVSGASECLTTTNRLSDIPSLINFIDDSVVDNPTTEIYNSVPKVATSGDNHNNEMTKNPNHLSLLDMDNSMLCEFGGKEFEFEFNPIQENEDEEEKTNVPTDILVDLNSDNDNYEEEEEDSEEYDSEEYTSSSEEEEDEEYIEDEE